MQTKQMASVSWNIFASPQLSILDGKFKVSKFVLETDRCTWLPLINPSLWSGTVSLQNSTTDMLASGFQPILVSCSSWTSTANLSTLALQNTEWQSVQNCSNLPFQTRATEQAGPSSSSSTAQFPRSPELRHRRQTSTASVAAAPAHTHTPGTPPLPAAAPM